MTIAVERKQSASPFVRISRAIDGLRQELAKSIVMLLAVLAIGWLVLYPLGILFDMSMRAKDGALTLSNYLSVLTEPGLAQALWNSLIISIVTTFFSIVIALPMAWAVSRTTMPCSGLVRAGVLIAFVIPNFITAIAWILLLGPNAGLINRFMRDQFGLPPIFDIYSMPGLILVLVFSFYPLIFFAVTAALDNMDPSYEEAAQMVGASAWRGSFGVALPLVLPAIVSSSVFVFLEAMGAFGAPAAIGNAAYFHTLTTKIYELFSYPPRFELAAAAATPIIVFTVLGLVFQRAALGRRRFNTIAGKAAKAHAVEIGWLKWLAFFYCMIVLIVSVVLPILVLIRASILTRANAPFIERNITARNYEALLDTSTILPNALYNSLILSAGTATACVFLAVIIVWLVERTTLPGRGLLTLTSTITFAFPGLALAVGFVLGYNHWPLNLYGTLWLFLIAFTAHRFPFAFMFVRNGVKQLSTELEEAGRMVGASWLRTIRDISVPLLRSGMLAAWMMVFAVSLRELSMAILLYVRGTETLPIAIFSYIDNGSFERAAAVSIVLIVLNLFSVLLLRWLSGKAHLAT